MQSAKFTNADGQIINFQYRNSNFILDTIDDRQFINNWTTKGYNQHGSTYIKSLMDERKVTITFYLYADTAEQFYSIRDEMYAICSPYGRGLGELVITNNASSKALDVYLNTMPVEVETYGLLRQYKVEFIAANPFYRSLDYETATFKNAAGGLTFDIAFEEQPGIIFGTSSRTVEVQNKGIIPAPVIIEITGAQVTNPVLTFRSKLSETSNFIGLNATITPSDEVLITTGYGQKDVLINGVSRTRDLMDGSSWVTLPVGDVIVSSSVTDGDPNITLKWYNYYAG